MVILSVSVVNKKGKILMARQYVPMSRLRIEGLLAAFPKLVYSEENANKKQHTFIETDEVRYIYQPMDMLYLLLITNMQSNILEDLSTLRMIAKLIPEYCQGHDETAVEEHAFDLIFAIDEVVSPMGYREQVNYKQIEDYTKMDSAEAKLNEIIKKSKEDNQKQFMKDQAKKFDDKRKKEMKIQMGARGGLASKLGDMGIQLSQLGGIGSDSTKAISSDSLKLQSSLNNEPTITYNNENRISGFGGGNDSSSDDQNNRNKYISKHKSKKKKKGGARVTGFKLGNASKNKDKLFDEQLNADKTLLQTNLLSNNLLSSSKNISKNDGSDEIDNNEPLLPVEITIIEKLTILLDRDGAMKKFDVKGDMEVVINNPDAGKCMININRPKNKINGFDKINWRLHPRMDNNSFKNNILVLKDENKSFKIGRRAKTSILKWRMACNDDNLIPIKVDFWPEADNGKITVNVRYQIENDDIELNNAIITLPTPTDEEPDVISCDGQYTFYKREHELQWNLGDLKTEDEGTFEYTLEDVELEELWPISIHFEMPTTYSQIEVSQVTSRTTDEEFEFGTKNQCNADNYSIQ